MKLYLTKDKSGTLKIHKETPVLNSERMLNGDSYWTSEGMQEINFQEFKSYNFVNAPMEIDIK